MGGTRMILCVEERDIARELSPSGAAGYTHYFSWPEMKRIKVYAHGCRDREHPDWGNDSGQSVVFGEKQFQVICYRETPYNFILRSYHNPHLILGKWNFTKPGHPRHVLRSLGVTMVEGVFYATNWYDDKSTQLDTGIYRMWIEGKDLRYDILTTKVGGNNISFRNGILYLTSESDNILKVLTLSGQLARTFTLPDPGDDHYRGCTWMDDSLLVSSSDTRSILVMNERAELERKIDMSSYIHHPDNHLPYGLWCAPAASPSPLDVACRRTG
jgi:hypothetical protein